MSVKNIFVNLAVNDLKKSMDFFKKLGFKFNPDFTDDNAACMIIGENIYSMLITHKHFKSFVSKEIVDSHNSIEVINALGVDSKQEVDKLGDQALAIGGKPANPLVDYGWMYGKSFFDLDGHMWEVFFMDQSKRPKNPGVNK